MHVSTKEVAADEKQSKLLGVPVGTHVITNTIEADGAFELASKTAEFDADVLAVSRTASGGVKLVTALRIREPKPAAPAKPEDANLAFLKSKGLSDAEAGVALERFGHDRVQARRQAAEAEKGKALDGELDALLAETAAPATPAEEAK